MAERSVVIRLKGDVSQFVASMKQAGASAKAEIGKQLDALSDPKRKAALNELGNSAGKIGLAAAAGLGAIVATTANFDQAMSKVQAATHESTQNMAALREAAIKAGADTVFSASEAAAGIENLAKAGVSTGDILKGGLRGALNLAAAGELDVKDAAEMAATAMNQFGLKGKDVPHIADLLAAAAGKAQGEVSDMANSLKYVGPVAAQMGISIEQTTGTIAELAAKGIQGEQAGTSLRGMLTSLTSPSKIAAETMSNLGIQLYDTSGKFVGFNGVAGQLHATLGNLTEAERNEALGRIFGNEQITAARILYAGGADAVDKWTSKVNDSGYAAETAGIKLDNLKGDLEQLKGSLETALIGAGENSQGMLRGLVQDATKVVNAFNKLPDSAKGVATGLAAITAVTGGGLWFGSKVIRGVSDTREALKSLGAVGDKTSTALKGVGKAGVIAAGLLAGAALADKISQIGDKALPGLEQVKGQLIDVANTGVATKLSSQFNDLGTSIQVLADPNAAQRLNRWASDSLGGLLAGGTLTNARNEVGSLDQALADLVQSGNADLAAKALQGINISPEQRRQLLTILPQYKDALAGVKNEAKLAGDAAGGAAGGIDAMGGAAGTATDPVAGLAGATGQAAKETKTWSDALGDLLVGLDKVAAADTFKKDLKGLGKDLKGGSLSRDTTAGLNNREEIRNRVTDLQSLAQAQADAGASGTKVVNTLLQGRAAIIKQATAAGVARGDIEKYLKTLGLTPDHIATSILLPGVLTAHEQVKALQKLYHLTPKEMKTLVIQANMDKSQANIKALAKEYHLTPKEVRTLISAPGVNDVYNAVRTYRSLLDSLDGKTVTSRIKLTQAFSDAGFNTKGGIQKAEGGYISGPGTSTSDSIPAYLSNGEYVVKAAAVDKYGRGMFDRLNAMHFATGGFVAASRPAPVQTFANGGPVAGGGGRQVPLIQVGTIRHNDMRETERWMRQQSVHAGGGGVTF